MPFDDLVIKGVIATYEAIKKQNHQDLEKAADVLAKVAGLDQKKFISPEFARKEFRVIKLKATATDTTLNKDIRMAALKEFCH